MKEGGRFERSLEVKKWLEDDCNNDRENLEKTMY